MTSPEPKSKSDRYREVKALLFEVLERETAERPAFLDEACRGDAELLGEIESLLAQIDQLDGFLDGRAGLEPALREDAALPRSPPNHLPFERFGDYSVLELIGYGGMGIVYLAEQRSPRRSVALKVLRTDSADELARQRFEREAEVLGRLRHSGIAQIYEAGVQKTDAGSVPFLVMEYVEGETIRDFARREKLGPREAFALIAEVGDALQHAHDQGVLHRDLKPGNIMVASTGEPKLLDFGVAWVRDDRELALRTRTGQLLGTIAYMSPEQARGGAVDARSDQFSLAVILYELLTDRLPFGAETCSIPDLVRSVVDGEPASLSEGDRLLRGDPHTIVHKALAKDPRRRYPSVAAFAEDLRNYVEGRSILARPPGVAYRAWRWLERHRLPMGASFAVLLALGSALAVSRGSQRETRAAEQVARREHVQAERLAQGRLLAHLLDEAEELWPASPELLPAIDRWLSRAEYLGGTLGEQRAYLEELRARSSASTPGADDWLLDSQSELVRQLAALASDEPAGLAARVRERRRRSAELVQDTVVRHRDAWRETLAAVADEERHPLYRGLHFEEQVGLVPLGADPDSGLFEFALHGPTGTVPRRDEQTGRLQLSDDMTLVFVLLPGARCLLGAQAQDPGAPNYDPGAQWHEGPPRLVELAPFFMSKYELTQGQWTGLGESPNPSYWEAGSMHACEIPFTDRSPVEHVGRLAALEFLRKLGCTLPTEAQWEYAARGGTSSRFWSGDDEGELQRLTNGVGWKTPADPYFAHAPAGTFPANGFGLHEITGNVWELCLDDYKVDYPRLPLRSGDGCVLADGGGDFSRRGGCASSPPAELRIAARSDARASHVTAHIGVRPVRAIAGRWSIGASARATGSAGEGE